MMQAAGLGCPKPTLCPKKSSSYERWVVAVHDHDLGCPDLAAPYRSASSGTIDVGRALGHLEHASRTSCMSRTCHLLAKQAQLWNLQQLW